MMKRITTVNAKEGDIGVGAREIGYLFGQYKSITSLFDGILTGKPYFFYTLSVNNV